MITTDTRLIASIRLALRDDDELVVFSSPPALRLGDLRGVRYVVAIDCRSYGLLLVEEAMHRLRVHVSSGVRIVAVTSLSKKPMLEVIGGVQTVATDVILSDHDDPGTLLRAIANGPGENCAAAVALQLLTPMVAPPLRGMLADVLGGGLRITTVKELAAFQGRERSFFQRIARHNGTSTPNDLIELAQASVAVLLSSPGGPPHSEVGVARGLCEAGISQTACRSRVRTVTRAVPTVDAPIAAGRCARVANNKASPVAAPESMNWPELISQTGVRGS